MRQEVSMKKLMIVGVALVAIAGCATNTETIESDTAVDTAYVAAVERAARQAGVEVHWYNMPGKRDRSR
jgi:uncharacterized lipoprotein YajG